MKKGVKAGKIFREGAFIAPIKSSTKNKFQVFKRVGKKRLPIKKQVVEIDKQVTSAIENTVLGQIPDKMISNLQQELRWELSKR